MIYIYECGSCGEYHPEGYYGECRTDGYRYAGDWDYAQRNNVMVESVEEVWLEDMGLDIEEHDEECDDDEDYYDFDTDTLIKFS